MGQATVDLPDPLEPPPVSAASTDDLLAQLAGEEIDRLLAEDESGRPTASPGAEKPPATGDVSPATSLTPGEAAESPVDSAAAPPPAAAPSTAASLNQLFAELDASGALKEPVAAAPIAEIESASKRTALPPAAASPATDLMEDDATLAAERGALDVSEPLAQAAQASVPAEVPTDAPADDAPPLEPLYVRVLEMINAPLAACSDDVRAAVGKIAIITAVNATAVLVYVFFFRHH